MPRIIDALGRTLIECSARPKTSERHGALRGLVQSPVTRLALGNTSNVKGVGSGVFGCKIDFGPVYRVYFGKDGGRL